MGRTSLTLQAVIVSLVLAFGALVAAPVHADALDDAKASGQVGERFDGYLGLVRGGAPDAVVELVNDINAKRRARFAEIAAAKGVSAAQVAAIAGAKAINSVVEAGEYYLPAADADWAVK